MKRLILICTLFLCFFVLPASDVAMSFSLSPSSRSFVTNLSDQKNRMLVSISQKEDGLSIKGPPFVSSFYQDWYVGEIRAAGLLSQLFDPSDKAFDVRDVKQFQYVATPALVPEYSGIAKRFNSVDFAVFSPVFNPLSPAGIFFDVHKAGLYAATAYLHYPHKEISDYMPSWQDLNESGVSMLGILGFCDSFSIYDFGVKTSVFDRFVFRENYGLAGDSGWNCIFSFYNQSFEIIRRIGSGSSKSPRDLIGFYAVSNNISIGYRREVYGNPTYGGEGQKKKSEFITRYSDGVFLAEIKHVVQGQDRTDKENFTFYALEYKTNECNIGINLEINRLRGTGVSVRKLDFQSKIKQAKFCINGTKYLLSITFIEDLTIDNQVVDFKICINQDRVYELSFKLSL